jgi:hypothetical protein
MDDSLRRLLRSIALGLPLVVPAGGLLIAPTLLACGHCDPTPVREAQVRVVEVASGGEEVVSCESLCESRFGEAPESCTLSATEASCTYERSLGHSCGGAGRRADAPAHATVAGLAAGGWLLETALLEASAVTAFRRTARALMAHGAPRALSRRALRAAEDERRHTALVATLAARQGNVAFAVRTDVHELPSLEALALENAREGCVGEAWGAIEAHAQSAHADDPAVRALMGRIAREEAMHALLSLDIDAWARGAGSSALSRALDDARVESRARLSAALATRSADAVGRPHGEAAVALAALLAA